MKKLILVLLLAIGLNGLAQKSGLIYDAHAQKRSVPAFTSIKVSSAIDLYLTQSNVNEVAVSASEDEIRDQIITEVVGGTLIIRLGESGSWFSWKKWGNYNTKAYVSIQEINALSASGASNVRIVGTLESPKMRIKMTGASDLKNANLNIGTLFMELSGASNVELAGNAEDLAIECSGASNAKLYNLLVKGATISSSGASNVSVSASQLLKMTASGASNIHYKGTAKVTQSNASGASNIRHKYD